MKQRPISRSDGEEPQSHLTVDSRQPTNQLYSCAAELSLINLQRRLIRRMRGRHRRLRRRVVHRRLGDLRDLLRDRLLCLFDRRQVALKHALLHGRVDGRLLQAEIVLCQALERGVEELDELGLRLEDPVC